MQPFLILKTGTAVDCVRKIYGDFEDWFAAGLGDSASVEVVDCTKTEPSTDAGNYAGIIVTGSAAMVSHREDWSERTGEWLKEAVAQGVPVLAVCYGHQLLAQAMGGSVGPNPGGRQIGSRLINLTAEGKADALLSNLPEQFIAQASHVESVLSLPDGAVRLADMNVDENYAYRIGDHAWSIQFHPEFSADATRGYIRARSEILVSEGLNPDELHDSVKDTPQAFNLIRKFADLALNQRLSKIMESSAVG